MSVPNSTASPRSASTFAESEPFDGADKLLWAWGRGMRPDADLTVSEWADTHRMLGSRASAEAASAAPAMSTRIINVLDPSIVGDYLATPSGERAILNVIRRNRGAINA